MLTKKIAVLWVLAVGIFVLLAASLHIGPQASVTIFVVNSMWLLLGIISIYLFVNEPNRAIRPIFFNFAGFAVYSAIATLYFFVGPGGTISSQSRYAAVYFLQYATAFYCFLLAFCIVYLVIDSLFSKFKIYQKYVSTLVIVGIVFLFYFSPFFSSVNYLYSTEDIANFRVVSKSFDELVDKGIKDPSAEQIAAICEMNVWNDGKQIGVLFDDQKVQRIKELLPYLEGDNYVLLIYKPLFLDEIYINVLCIVFIFLYFGYQYKNDPPQGAYIEKIIFLFLPYCSLEVLHNFAYIRSVQTSTFVEIMKIGQYLSLANLVMLTVFFGLRLRFITSVKGEFYERELVSDSEHISRWRDAFDNLVVRHFLNPKAIHGRLFAPRTPRSEA